MSEPSTVPALAEVDQVIVMSGSASPVTAAQIEWAGVNGYALLRLNAARLLDSASVDDERELIVAAALDKLAQGKSVVLYTALGPDDPAIASHQRTTGTTGHRTSYDQPYPWQAAGLDPS